MQPGPTRYLTNVRSDGVGREMGCDIEHPVAAHVILHWNCLAEISIELWESSLKVC